MECIHEVDPAWCDYCKPAPSYEDNARALQLALSVPEHEVRLPVPQAARVVPAPSTDAFPSNWLTRQFLPRMNYWPWAVTTEPAVEFATMVHQYERTMYGEVIDRGMVPNPALRG
jgi:hypothetical protein